LFERYTERARRAIFYGRYEAARSHPPIEPEHLLLGILHDSGTMIAAILKDYGLDAATLRADALRAWPPASDTPAPADVPLSARSKTALDLAQEESSAVAYLGVEHLLLGVLREGGPAAHLLGQHGLDAAVTRRTVAAILEERQRP
jgi:ATP-dependent Clp protease ATP-binding subunit ClpC